MHSAHKITVHMVVKNEDQWVWFALHSILPYVHLIDVIDTGSTDNTIACIKSINSDKIRFESIKASTPKEISQIRQLQLDRTKTSWFWLVDGDEIYPNKTAQEVVEATKNSSYEGVVVRRFDLLGDIYHRQHESVGTYKFFNMSGHLVLRLLNKDKLSGLHLAGDYPNEGYYDADGVAVIDHDPKKYYITESALYHAMYLKRSSLGENLGKVMVNRSKYKVEVGLPIRDPHPEIFLIDRPAFVPDPLKKRKLSYDVAAKLVSPVKALKRKLVK